MFPSCSDTSCCPATPSSRPLVCTRVPSLARLHTSFTAYSRRYCQSSQRAPNHAYISLADQRYEGLPKLGPSLLYTCAVLCCRIGLQHTRTTRLSHETSPISHSRRGLRLTDVHLKSRGRAGRPLCSIQSTHSLPSSAHTALHAPPTRNPVKRRRHNEDER